MSRMIGVERIRAAAGRARPHVLRTPLIPVNGVLLKLECLQPTGSFKVRGFFAAALALPDEKLRRGLITVSAGNAAQACAYVAKTLGVSCRVVMFDTAPPPKVEGVKRWGATPISMSRDALLRWMAEEGWNSEPEVFIHPFAEPEVMAGHGGLALELLEDMPDLARVLVPVGGGGLVGGIASAIKGLRPQVEVIGVERGGQGFIPDANSTFQDGDQAHVIVHRESLDKLIPIVYEELRRQAVEHLRGADGHALLTQILDEGQQLALQAAGRTIGNARVDLAAGRPPAGGRLVGRAGGWPRTGCARAGGSTRPRAGARRRCGHQPTRASRPPARRRCPDRCGA